jgi:hypothetical protein
VNGSSSRRRSGSERHMSDRQALPTSVPLWIAVPTIGDSPSLIVQPASDPPGSLLPESLLEVIVFTVHRMHGECGWFRFIEQAIVSPPWISRLHRPKRHRKVAGVFSRTSPEAQCGPRERHARRVLLASQDRPQPRLPEQDPAALALRLNSVGWLPMAEMGG